MSRHLRSGNHRAPNSNGSMWRIDAGTARLTAGVEIVARDFLTAALRDEIVRRAAADRRARDGRRRR
jgi:hypothetical protein